MYQTEEDRHETVFGVIGSQNIAAYRSFDALENQVKAIRQSTSVSRTISETIPNNADQSRRCQEISRVFALLEGAFVEARKKLDEL